MSKVLTALSVSIRAAMDAPQSATYARDASRAACGDVAASIESAAKQTARALYQLVKDGNIVPLRLLVEDMSTWKGSRAAIVREANVQAITCAPVGLGVVCAIGDGAIVDLRSVKRGTKDDALLYETHAARAFLHSVEVGAREGAAKSAERVAKAKATKAAKAENDAIEAKERASSVDHTVNPVASIIGTLLAVNAATLAQTLASMPDALVTLASVLGEAQRIHAAMMSAADEAQRIADSEKSSMDALNTVLMSLDAAPVVDTADAAPVVPTDADAAPVVDAAPVAAKTKRTKREPVTM